MELVYLWVEDYKNIHHQGFNFSPRFRCEFKDEYEIGADGKEKLKDDCELVICDKEDAECKNKEECKEFCEPYIKDFFGGNINVTAIVGKNGSGKSSVLKLILFLLFCKNYKKEDSYPIGTLSYALKQFSNKELFLILHDGSEFKKIAFSSFIRHLQNIEFVDKDTTRIVSGSIPRDEEILENIPEANQDEITFFTFYLNYMLDTLHDGFHDNWVNQIYHKQDNYNTPLLIQPNKHDTNTLSDSINLYMIDFSNKQRLLLLYKDISKNQKITSFFNPNYLKIKNDFVDNFRVNMRTSDGTDLEIIKKIANKLNLLLYVKKKEYELDNTKIPVSFKDIEDKKDYEYMNLLYVAFKILVMDKDLFHDDKYSELEEKVFVDIENNKLPDKDYLKRFDFESIIQADANDYRIRKVQISIDFDKHEVYDDSNFKSLMNDEKVLIDDLKDILEYLPMWIDIVFYENSKSFDSLSSGEKSIFRMLIDMVYQIEKVKIHYSSINIFLDETELGLHPQWQKEYLKNITETISLYVNDGFNVNLVFATHSPFLLSDIPKQNIIFLDTDEEGNCKVVDGLKEKKETFGANIHTLLSDSFFMSDGLMGEFAKSKIDKAFELLNKQVLEKEEIGYCEQIIAITGEPILKTQMQKMLDSKRLQKIDKVEELEQQIEALTAQVEELKKR